MIVFFLFHLPLWFSRVLAMNNVLGVLSCYLYFAVRPRSFMTELLGLGKRSPWAVQSSVPLNSTSWRKGCSVTHWRFIIITLRSLQTLSIYYDNFWELRLCSRFSLFITSNWTALWSPIPKALLSIFLTSTEIPSCKSMKQFHIFIFIAWWIWKANLYRKY